MNLKVTNKLVVLFVIINIINAEDYESEGSDASSSIDSESKEIYNTSSKEKPRLERYERSPKSPFVTKTYIDHVEDPQNTNISIHQVHKFSNFPFSVSIQKRGSHYATGALVNRKWILSAAELFYNVRESIKLFKARLGSVNCKQGGSLFNFKGIEIHPQYIYNEPNFDLALLRIAGTLETSEVIRPVRLPKDNRIVQLKFWTTYWPRLIVQGKVLSSSANERVKQNRMRVSSQQVVPWTKCHILLQASNIRLDLSSLCLEPIKSRHSACMPDPGAPIVADNNLWGITSGWTSKDCLKRPSPTVFSRISTPGIRSWIVSTIQD